MSANPDGGSLQAIYDIAAVLERTSEIRVIPVVGRGSAQNVKDIIYLNGIDMAIIQPHIVKYFQKIGEITPDINRRIAYITTLFADDIHVFSHGGIKSFEDLRNKRVNFSVKGSGTQISMRLVFEAFGIEVQEFNMRQADAFELMKQGRLDATACTCSRPLKEADAFKETIEGFRLLSIPYTAELENTFFPGLISHKDYPDLIPPGQSLNTIAVQTMLGVYNWRETQSKRYKRVGRFIDAFFDNIKEFHTFPRQPKWWSVNIAARVLGFERFAYAQAWLDRKSASSVSASSVRVKSSTRIDINSNSEKGTNRSGGQSGETTTIAPPPPSLEQNKINNQLPEWARRDDISD